MLASLLLALREGLEAALIISIVLGSVRKTGRSHLERLVWVGALSAALLSLLAAMLMTRLGAGLEGRAEELYEGSAMLLAAGVLTWMIFWMRGQAVNFKGALEQGVQEAAQGSRNGWALFLLAFLAVGREGFELALFVTASAMASGAIQSLLGALAGLAIAILLGYLLFTATVRLDLRRFFQVTSVLLILFSAGLVAYGVHEFNEAGLIPPIIEHVWDINPILDEDSFFGQLMKALFGYNGNPSLSEVLAYGAYFVVLWLVRRLFYSSSLSQRSVPPG